MTEEYTAWINVPENLKTRTQLARLGLHPARDQQPAAQFCSYIRGKRRPTYYDLYEVDQAEPKPAATEAQLAALEKARLERDRRRTCQRCGHTSTRPLRHFPHCRRCHDHLEAVEWARRVLADPGAIILDTETTDLDGEPVEIGIIDIGGNVLLDTLVQATEPISPEAGRIHGITGQMLIDAPTFPEVYPQLCHILGAASTIIIYNASFDRGILERSRKIHELPFYPVAEFYESSNVCYGWKGLECAMLWYAQWVGEWSNRYNDYKWQPLYGGHRALGDCRATLELLHKMAEDINEETTTTLSL